MKYEIIITSTWNENHFRPLNSLILRNFFFFWFNLGDNQKEKYIMIIFTTKRKRNKAA